MQKLSEVCGSFLQGTTGPGTWGPSPKESKHTAAYTSLIECRFRQPNFHLTVTAQVGSAVESEVAVAHSSPHDWSLLVRLREERPHFDCRHGSSIEQLKSSSSLVCSGG